MIKEIMLSVASQYTSLIAMLLIVATMVAGVVETVKKYKRHKVAKAGNTAKKKKNSILYL